MKYSLPADLWSAGIIAYQLVTGRLPFAGEEGEEVSTRYMNEQQFDHKVRCYSAVDAATAQIVSLSMSKSFNGKICLITL